MDKTIVVRVEKRKVCLKYKKKYKIHKNYKVHDEKNEFKTGDKVIIEETRPLSKEKRWRVIKRIEADRRGLQSRASSLRGKHTRR